MEYKFFRKRLVWGIKKTGLAAIVSLPLLFSGCSTFESIMTGTLGGGAVGGIIGHQSGKTAEGALIGAGVGALGGYLYNRDQEERDYRYR